MYQPGDVRFGGSVAQDQRPQGFHDPSHLVGPVGQRQIVACVKSEVSNQESFNEHSGFAGRYFEGLFLALYEVLLAHRSDFRNQFEVFAQAHEFIQRWLNVKNFLACLGMVGVQRLDVRRQHVIVGLEAVCHLYRLPFERL